MPFNPGDISFVGYNADGSFQGPPAQGTAGQDQFAFVVNNTVVFAEGETLRFTDNAFVAANGGFNTNEGTLTYAAPTGGTTLEAGTVVVVTAGTSATNAGTIQVADGSGGFLATNIGTVTGTGTSQLNLAAAGDQISAYTGASASPTVVAFFDTGPGTTFVTGNNSTSDVPGGTGQRFNFSDAGPDNISFNTTTPPNATTANDPASYQPTSETAPFNLASIACFLRGTLIATPAGEVAIEDLAIGDLVLTAAGAARPIMFIGRRAYLGRFAANNPQVLPILMRAGSLGADLPRRDLMVSPEHAMALDGALVAARLLVDGTSIRQVRGPDPIEYFHIELDSHDVILAEGAPTESFVDCYSRRSFHNEAEFVALYPDDQRPSFAFCAPRVEDGPELQAILAKLPRAAERAAA